MEAGNYLRRLYELFRANYQVALLTFELFWIAVFLIDRLHGGGGGVPRFVYVNF